jgi:uncharacterized protein (DUF885 family)
MYKRILKRVTILIIVLCLSVIDTSCDRPSKKELAQNHFDTFMNDLFVEEVQADTLSLNYSLAYPENYGIKDKTATLGDYGISQMKEDLAKSENYLNRLQSFHYNLLTSSQQLTYDIVKNIFEQSLQFSDYMYYSECLGPTTGIQAQLPTFHAHTG